MQKTTNYELNIVEGSDTVNPLTVDNPNYRKIDETMYANQIATTPRATEIKSGNIHAITCLVEGVTFFHFTAVSDYKEGDTFSFNSTPVVAVLPDGSGLPENCFRINSEVLASVVGTRMTIYSFAAGSTTASDAEKLGGKVPTYYAPYETGVVTYNHSRIGNVNNFTYTAPEGSNAGANGKVKMVANIQLGDKIQINGTQVTAFAGIEDFVSTIAGESIVGKWLTFTYDKDAATVNFKFGGGLSASKLATATAAPADVRNGKTFYAGDGNLKTGTATFGADICGAMGFMQYEDGPQRMFTQIDKNGYITFSRDGKWESRRQNMTVTATIQRAGNWKIDSYGWGSCATSSTYYNYPASTASTHYNVGDTISFNITFRDTVTGAFCTVFSYIP